MLGNLAKFSGLRVFALVLLVIATPEGRQTYDRTKAVEAQRGIKTLTWDAVEDNDYEFHQEHEDEEHDEDSLDSAFEKRSRSDGSLCSYLNEALSNCRSKAIEKVCQPEFGCECRYDPSSNSCARCVKRQKSGKRQKNCD